VGRLQKKKRNKKTGKVKSNQMNEEIEKYQLLIQLKTLYTIVDKLEQRISKLEKVLESHAKCIGELRGNE